MAFSGIVPGKAGNGSACGIVNSAVNRILISGFTSLVDTNLYSQPGGDHRVSITIRFSVRVFGTRTVFPNYTSLSMDLKCEQ